MTIKNRLLGDRHPTVTVTVTEKTAWVSGFLADVTVVTLVTVLCGYFLGARGVLHLNYERPQEVGVCSESKYNLQYQNPTFGAMPVRVYGENLLMYVSRPCCVTRYMTQITKVVMPLTKVVNNIT